jgi:hypothetical protein
MRRLQAMHRVCRSQFTGLHDKSQERRDSTEKKTRISAAKAIQHSSDDKWLIPMPTSDAAIIADLRISSPTCAEL